MPSLDSSLALEAKVFTALAFLNGPIENLHAGSRCPQCSDNPEYSRVSDQEMRELMKSAVNTVYHLLWQRENDPEAYAKSLLLGQRYTRTWDDPEV